MAVDEACRFRRNGTGRPEPRSSGCSRTVSPGAHPATMSITTTVWAGTTHWQRSNAPWTAARTANQPPRPPATADRRLQLHRTKLCRRVVATACAWCRTCGLMPSANNEVDVLLAMSAPVTSPPASAAGGRMIRSRYLRGDRRRACRRSQRDGLHDQIPATAPSWRSLTSSTPPSSEECGEVARAVLDSDYDQLRTELIQRCRRRGLPG